MTTNFHPSYLESLTFAHLRVTLAHMQVRYSLRKDATREYLLQVLKRHLDVMWRISLFYIDLEDEHNEHRHYQAHRDLRKHPRGPK